LSKVLSEMDGHSKRVPNIGNFFSDLSKSFFQEAPIMSYGIMLLRIRREINQPTSLSFYQLFHFWGLMKRGIINDDNLPRFKDRA
jgi:hypothetical protein